VPLDVYEQYKEVTLSVDVMFVNQLPMFITVSHHIKFGTVALINNCQRSTLVESLRQVQTIYLQRGFVICAVLADGEFEMVRPLP